MQHFLIEFIAFAGLGCIDSNLLIGEQGKMMDKDACSLFEGILGMNRSVSSDFEDKLVVVGLLVTRKFSMTYLTFFMGV